MISGNMQANRKKKGRKERKKELNEKILTELTKIQNELLATKRIAPKVSIKGRGLNFTAG